MICNLIWLPPINALLNLQFASVSRIQLTVNDLLVSLLHLTFLVAVTAKKCNNSYKSDYSNTNANREKLPPDHLHRRANTSTRTLPIILTILLLAITRGALPVTCAHLIWLKQACLVAMVITFPSCHHCTAQPQGRTWDVSARFTKSGRTCVTTRNTLARLANVAR